MSALFVQFGGIPWCKDCKISENFDGNVELFSHFCYHTDSSPNIITFYGLNFRMGVYIMDPVFDEYKEEAKKRIDAWEGVKTEDFQYEPERAELKAQMKEWLSGRIDEPDEKALNTKNKKFFARCMAALVYEENVKPHLADFLK